MYFFSIRNSGGPFRKAIEISGLSLGIARNSSTFVRNNKFFPERLVDSRCDAIADFSHPDWLESDSPHLLAKILGGGFKYLFMFAPTWS